MATEPSRPEQFDVLIVGAGLSGVGAAYHLTRQCPGTTFLVLEAQESFDGRAFVERAASEPEAAKQDLLTIARAYLGPDYLIDKHFTPNYRPWRQRIALIPDGDLYKHSLRQGLSRY